MERPAAGRRARSDRRPSHGAGPAVIVRSARFWRQVAPLQRIRSWPWCGNLGFMELAREVEFVFEPEAEGGYHAYAPELPGLHTQGEDLEEATANAEEALALYVEGLREEGRPLGMGVVRRRLQLPV